MQQMQFHKNISDGFTNHDESTGRKHLRRPEQPGTMAVGFFQIAFLLLASRNDLVQINPPA